MTAEGAKGNYDQAKAVILATDNFRDQVINHLGSQQFLGNFKISESLVNECSKQQDMWDFFNFWQKFNRILVRRLMLVTVSWILYSII